MTHLLVTDPVLTPAKAAPPSRMDAVSLTRWAKAGKLTSIRTPGGHGSDRVKELRELLAGLPHQHPGA